MSRPPLSPDPSRTVLSIRLVKADYGRLKRLAHASGQKTSTLGRKFIIEALDRAQAAGVR